MAQRGMIAAEMAKLKREGHGANQYAKGSNDPSARTAAQAAKLVDVSAPTNAVGMAAIGLQKDQLILLYFPSRPIGEMMAEHPPIQSRLGRLSLSPTRSGGVFPGEHSRHGRLVSFHTDGSQ